MRYDLVVHVYRIGMAGKQAKVLFDHHVQALLAYATASRYPVRNRVIVLLSVKAGLRAGEIANLTWPMVVDPSGDIASHIELHDAAAKNRSGRRVPLHNDLRRALAQWREISDGVDHVVDSERGGGLTPRPSSTGSPPRIGTLGWRDARPILAAGHSSPVRRGWCTRQAGRYAMFSFSPVTGPFRQPRPTSTAIPMFNAGWWR